MFINPNQLNTQYHAVALVTTVYSRFGSVASDICDSNIKTNFFLCRLRAGLYLR